MEAIYGFFFSIHNNITWVYWKSSKINWNYAKCLAKPPPNRPLKCPKVIFDRTPTRKKSPKGLSMRAPYAPGNVCSLKLTTISKYCFSANCCAARKARARASTKNTPPLATFYGDGCVVLWAEPARARARYGSIWTQIALHYKLPQQLSSAYCASIFMRNDFVQNRPATPNTRHAAHCGRLGAKGGNFDFPNANKHTNYHK